MIASHDDLKPEIGTAGSAGIDLKIDRDVILMPGHSAKVGTGIKVEIPEGFFGMIVPRSGLGSKGLNIMNSTGIIDSDYRGEIMANLVNKGHEELMLWRGERILQMILVPHAQYKILFVDEFETTTERGEGGFGSTGK